MNILMDQFDPAGLQTIQIRLEGMGWSVVVVSFVPYKDRNGRNYVKIVHKSQFHNWKKVIDEY